MWITVIAGALLMAAASPVLSADEPVAPPADANLFVFRDYAEPTAWAPTIKIDGRKLVAIGQNQYTAVHLAPGTHRIQLAWPFLAGQRGREGSLTVADGETIYLEVVGTSRYDGYYFVSGSGLARRENATAQIADCCTFKPPKL